MTPPARYFPVHEGPYRMRAGLRRFPVDLGNGAADTRYFQIDDERPRYLGARRDARARQPQGEPRHAVLNESRAHARAHAAVLAWIDETLAAEHAATLEPGEAPLSEYDARLQALQEDSAVIQRGADGREAVIMVDVDFPSGWRPERILGTSFAAIHGPVPDFADRPAVSQSMVDAMIERGPYLRFVWTVCSDLELDHHPDFGLRERWQDAAAGALRVERQISVPFPAVCAALFLIRTYVYPFTSLQPEQRTILSRAIEQMPDDVSRYKGLAGHQDRIQALLADCDALGRRYSGQ